MENNDFEIIEKIKQLKINGNIGWAKHLIPLCESYFDDDLPLSFIKVKIAELYDFDVSIHTLKSIRTKYKKSIREKTPQHDLTNKTTAFPKAKLKKMTTNSGKVSSPEREEKDQLLEKVIKNMADFDNKSTENRTELDDLLEWQQQQKLHHT
ncbi:hypothetical protein VB796_23095 [Arcicella sp. LKC2W]|uniref:hypothetical protein n=1 Tax=Arcicella sp. LKC2W TaxID=2984198 RepID=UPI002B20BDB7|nr:hypothetical protein [Arcicella sp. LKC2W]MEA5461976.1 hypothetical protein [Arcicella sp. LKC2W]